MASIGRRLRSPPALVLLGAFASCTPHDLPPGPEDPAKNLSLHDRFASDVERGGLLTAWVVAAEPGNPAPTVRGVLPLGLIRPQEMVELGRRLRDPADLRLVGLVADAAANLQAGIAPGPARAIEQIRVLRVRHGLSDGTDRDRVLAEDPDPAVRRATWLRFAAAGGELAPLVRDLVKARNRWATERDGQAFLADFRQHRGYDPDAAQRLRTQVSRSLAPPPGGALADPWDGEAMDPALIARIGDTLDGEGCLDRAREVLTWAGLPVEPAGLTVIVSGPGSGGGFAGSSSYPIDPPGDVRLLVSPRAGLFSYWTTLHEVGHAAQALLAPRGGHSLMRRVVSPAVAESCGKIGERLAYAPEWLARHGLPAADIAALAGWERASEVWRMRHILADTAFEEAIYANPDADLDRTYVELQERIAATRAPPGGAAWAIEKNLVFKPLSRFDYLLARCAQAAVYRRLRALPGGLLGAEATRVLREEVLGAAPGRRFEEWLQRAVGELPSCRAWLEDVAGIEPSRASP